MEVEERNHVLGGVGGLGNEGLESSHGGYGNSRMQQGAWKAARLMLFDSSTPLQEETASMLDDLYRLWFAHLWDNIPSVREDSAVALANVVRSYGQEAVERILPQVCTASHFAADFCGGVPLEGQRVLHLSCLVFSSASFVAHQLEVMLPMAKDQANDSKRYGGLENTTTFGVAAKRARDNDEKIHTNQVVPPCLPAALPLLLAASPPSRPLEPAPLPSLSYRPSSKPTRKDRRSFLAERHLSVPPDPADDVFLWLSCSEASEGWLHGPLLLQVICLALLDSARSGR